MFAAPRHLPCHFARTLRASCVGLAFAAFAVGHVHAQQAEKNGMPCVAEVCLGDGPEDMAKVPWERAKNPFSPDSKPLYVSTIKVRDGDLRMLKHTYPGDVSRSAAFLSAGQFDAEALRALSDVTSACNLKELEGIYKSPSGHPTRVKIALLPAGADNASQRWTVTSIVRMFPTAVTREQQADVTAQLKERYAGFDIMKAGNPKPGQGRFAMNQGSLFGFHMFRFGGLDLVNRLKAHPACGGTAKVKVD